MEERGTREYTGRELLKALCEIADMTPEDQKKYLNDYSSYGSMYPLEYIVRYRSVERIMDGVKKYKDAERTKMEKESRSAMSKIITFFGYYTAKEMLEEVAKGGGEL